MTLNPSASDLAFQDPYGMWHVIAPEDVEHCLSNEDQFGKEAIRAAYQAHTGPYFEFIGSSPFLLEGPLHTVLYEIINSAFAPHAITQLTTRIREVSKTLLDALDGRTSFDLVADYAYPLPYIIISDLLGVPSTDRLAVQKLVDEIAFGHDPLKGEEDARLANEATSRLYVLFSRLIDQRRTAPTDDLISQLIVAQQQYPDLITDTVISGTCISVFLAGHDNSKSLIVNVMLDLLKEPEQFLFLREHPEWIGRAIEVSLAKDSPTAFTMRSTKGSASLPQTGRKIPANCPLVLHIGKANRLKFFAHSELFDVKHHVQGHYAFGVKANRYCPGAHLARLEAKIALGDLLMRFPTLRPGIDTSQLKRRDTPIQPTLESLPVVL